MYGNVDQYDKLTLYGFFIHRTIDRFSRKAREYREYKYKVKQRMFNDFIWSLFALRTRFSRVYSETEIHQC
jgi:hypothetical protein